MALDVYDESELAESSFARILLTGDPKAGKTTCVLCTAPQPILVLNCDKPGAPMAAKRHGAKFKTVDVETSGVWREAVRYAISEAKAERVATIVVDTVTMLINNCLALEMKRKFQGFDIWREVHAGAMQPMNDLLAAQAHVFMLAHYAVSDGQITVQGGMKTDIPALIHDRVHLEFNPKNTPARFFHIGPSASGLSGGRNSDESKIIAADVGVLLKELGIGQGVTE